MTTTLSPAIEIDPARFHTRPFAHQRVGIRELVARPAFALFDDPRTGKSKQVVDAACALFDAGRIDAVVVVAPASCRGVWADADLGQVRAYAWVRSVVFEYHQKLVTVWGGNEPWDETGPLPWVVTNYEFIRPLKDSWARLTQLLKLLRPFKNFMLVVDESSALNNHRSGQTKAVARLRDRAARCVILNGTPISKNPLDLWSQLNVLDPLILGRAYQNFWHFRASCCQLGGWHDKQVLGWRTAELERVQALIKPHCVRRLIDDCHDLPPKLPATYEVPLTAETWRLYQKLRREALLYLPDRQVVPEPNAGVRIMRLAQLTSGHVSVAAAPDDAQEALFVEPEVRFVSAEKLGWTLEYLTTASTATASIVWCRFRPERERLAAALRAAGITTYEIYGGQKAAERAAAVAAFHSSTRGSTARRVAVAQPVAGGIGLDLAAATEEIYQSNERSLKVRLQSEERARHPAQTSPLAVIDLLATGPGGQRTIDHVILAALRRNEELATWTCAAWRRALADEETR